MKRKRGEAENNFYLAAVAVIAIFGVASLLIYFSRSQPQTVIVSEQGALKNFNDLYSPPMVQPVMGMIPINVLTQGARTEYQQLGILERKRDDGQEMILPLMGRQISTGRDKWQYYSVSNTGMLNSKLPIIVDGRDGLSETGCNGVSSGDLVFVKGYNDRFKVTLYDRNQLQYLPY